LGAATGVAPAGTGHRMGKRPGAALGCLPYIRLHYFDEEPVA